MFGGVASLHQIYVTLLTDDWSSLGLRSLTQNSLSYLLEPVNSEVAQTKCELTWIKTQTGFVLQATELSMNSTLKIIHQNLKAFQFVKVSRFGGHCVSKKEKEPDANCCNVATPLWCSKFSTAATCSYLHKAIIIWIASISAWLMLNASIIV